MFDASIPNGEADLDDSGSSSSINKDESGHGNRYRAESLEPPFGKCFTRFLCFAVIHYFEFTLMFGARTKYTGSSNFSSVSFKWTKSIIKCLFSDYESLDAVRDIFSTMMHEFSQDMLRMAERHDNLQRIATKFFGTVDRGTIAEQLTSNGS